MSPRLLVALVIIDVYATQTVDLTKDGLDNIMKATDLHNAGADALRAVGKIHHDRQRQEKSTHDGKSLIDEAIPYGTTGLNAYILYKKVFKKCLKTWEECKSKIKTDYAKVQEIYGRLAENVKWIKTKLMTSLERLLSLAKSFLTDLRQGLRLGTTFEKSGAGAGEGAEAGEAGASATETAGEAAEAGEGTAEMVGDVLVDIACGIALAETPSGDMEEMTRLLRILQRGDPPRLPATTHSLSMLAVGAAIAGLCFGLWLSRTFAPQTRQMPSQEMLLG